MAAAAKRVAAGLSAGANPFGSPCFEQKTLIVILHFIIVYFIIVYFIIVYLITVSVIIVYFIIVYLNIVKTSRENLWGTPPGNTSRENLWWKPLGKTLWGKTFFRFVRCLIFVDFHGSSWIFIDVH